METASLPFLTISELAALIGTRQVSPVEVTEAYLDRIDQVEERVNAFITMMTDEALEAARRAEQAIQAGQYLGPLHGVPIGLKDLFYTRGVRTTAGSQVKRWAEFVPKEAAAEVARLRQAGAIILGKLNLHEFAAGATNDNPHYGPCRNPWGLTRITGGSSGGSGAAVAAGLCAAAMGTDTGGSVRIPAALCGVVGLKPTYGRVSRHGIVPLAWSLDHAGPLARSVQDAALVLNAIAGHDPRDPASAEVDVPDFTRHLGDGTLSDFRMPGITILIVILAAAWTLAVILAAGGHTTAGGVVLERPGIAGGWTGAEKVTLGLTPIQDIVTRHRAVRVPAYLIAVAVADANHHHAVVEVDVADPWLRVRDAHHRATAADGDCPEDGCPGLPVKLVARDRRLAGCRPVVGEGEVHNQGETWAVEAVDVAT